MSTTKEALNLFLKSLPDDSLFEVISFGSEFRLLSQEISLNPSQESMGIEYSDENVRKAIEHVSKFSANMGGTEIFEPLESAIKLEVSDPSIKKQIFLLTDGEVSKPDKVINLARDAATVQGLSKIHTFGVGSDCSKHLVENVAKVGNGICSLVIDSKAIRSKVI